MFLQKIKENIRLKFYFDKLSRNSYDGFASLIIHDLFPAGTVLPFTPFSLNPNTILHIINDINLNSRKKVLEFGSGLSTIIMARYIKANNITCSIYSIEDNIDWAQFIQEQLIKFGCEEVVKILVSPLKSNYDNVLWYDESLINSFIRGHRFDVVVVDGPSAKHDEKIRESSLYQVIDNLANNFFIVLDDIKRKGESKIYDNWSHFLKKRDIRFKALKSHGDVYGYFVGGTSFSANPLTH